MRTYKYKLWNHRKGVGIMKRYSEYKESGMAWIGEIPEHWNLKRAKFIFRRLQRPVRENDEIITAFRNGIVTLRKNRRTLGFTNSLKEIGYQGLRKDDLVIHAMDGHAGAIGVSDSDGKSSPVYSVCRPIAQDNVYYYAYLLRYMALSGFIESLARGIRERSTNFRFNEFKELDLLSPTVPEQSQIANFLDRKTGQIDELIRIKERQVELLQEQRTTLINQTVTKGLDPNVEMKPSEVEWIGEIPGHWKMINTKYLFRLVTEPAPQNNDYELLSIYTDIGVKPRKELEERGNRATTTDGYWLVKKGDFIVNKLLAWMGAIGLSNYEGVTSPAYDILRKIRPLNERFYEYLFRCGLYFTEFKKWSRGIMEVRLRLYFDQFGQIPLVFPPVDEQNKIVNFLDRKTGQIDELITTEQRKIELLKEYRQSLISEVVTGKIDVRNEV